MANGLNRHPWLYSPSGAIVAPVAIIMLYSLTVSTLRLNKTMQDAWLSPNLMENGVQIGVEKTNGVKLISPGTVLLS
ncbi:MAG: hypothetical protein MJ110_01030 [Lachnospiraceae bacterium]|nr:hypothetical protein [Lachnospiraceae bacterium]